MAREFAVRIVNARTVSFAPMACDVAIGYTEGDGKFVGLAIVPDFILKKSATKGYYFSGPSKPFVKNGEIQKDDNGYDKHLEFWKLYGEVGGGKDPNAYGITNAAWEFRKYLIQLMVETYESLGGSSAGGSGGAKKPAKPAARRQAAKPAPAAAATAIDEDEVGMPDDEEDDSYPF